MVGKIQRVNQRERCLRQRGVFLTGIAGRRTESISWKIALLGPNAECEGKDRDNGEAGT